MGNPRLHGKSTLKMGLEPMSLIDIKGCRSKAFSTCLPVSLPLLHSSIIEKLGEGKVGKVLAFSLHFW